MPAEGKLRGSMADNSFKLGLSTKAWAKQILEKMVAPKGQRRALHASLVAQYKSDFVPDGKHKNSLVAGSNMKKLRPSTICELTRDAALNALLRGMGYGWFGWDERTRRSGECS